MQVQVAFITVPNPKRKPDRIRAEKTKTSISSQEQTGVTERSSKSKGNQTCKGQNPAQET